MLDRHSPLQWHTCLLLADRMSINQQLGMPEALVLARTLVHITRHLPGRKMRRHTELDCAVNSASCKSSYATNYSPDALPQLAVLSSARTVVYTEAANEALVVNGQ